MGAYNTAKTHVGAALDTAGTWAKAKGAQMGGIGSGTDWKGLGGAAKSQWSAANNASAGFLNPTAMGMGIGAGVGGAYGGFSDNGSVLGGMAGGALAGAGLGAAGYAGYNRVAYNDLWKGVSAQPGWGMPYKTSRYTNPHYHPTNLSQMNSSY